VAASREDAARAVASAEAEAERLRAEAGAAQEARAELLRARPSWTSGPSHATAAPDGRPRGALSQTNAELEEERAALAAELERTRAELEQGRAAQVPHGAQRDRSVCYSDEVPSCGLRTQATQAAQAVQAVQAAQAEAGQAASLAVAAATADFVAEAEEAEAAAAQAAQAAEAPLRAAAAAASTAAAELEAVGQVAGLIAGEAFDDLRPDGHGARPDAFSEISAPLSGSVCEKRQLFPGEWRRKL
jgi:hypothetical protein